MPPRDPQVVLQKLGETSLKVDAFFLRRTGFVANQTVLKLGEYNLNCVPASFGVVEGRFLAVLSPSEVPLFAKFKTGTHILILTFDDPDNKDIARFPLRVGLTDLVPVPNRKNVCMLHVRFKSMPAELLQFLGEFLEALEARQQSWETLSAQPLPWAAVVAAAVGWSGSAVLVSGDEKLETEVLKFHTKQVWLRPVNDELWCDRPSVQLRLRFRTQVLTLDGKTDPDGSFVLEFHPDWLELVEDYRFQLSLRTKTGRAVS